MHDSLLLEKIYQTVLELCGNHSITKVSGIKLVVSMDSHIDSAHMLGHLAERDCMLFGDWTKVLIEKKDIEKLTAVVTSIDGEKNE